MQREVGRVARMFVDGFDVARRSWEDTEDMKGGFE
jgi:hypothetical protein